MSSFISFINFYYRAKNAIINSLFNSLVFCLLKHMSSIISFIIIYYSAGNVIINSLFASLV